VGAAGGGLSGSERDRSAILRLVRRGLAHDAKVRQVPAGLLLLDRRKKAARSRHKVGCVLKRNMEDVIGLSVGSFAEDEACSWIKSTVRE
jgi:hypothetical protein